MTDWRVFEPFRGDEGNVNHVRGGAGGGRYTYARGGGIECFVRILDVAGAGASASGGADAMTQRKKRRANQRTDPIPYRSFVVTASTQHPNPCVVWRKRVEVL